MTAVGRIVKAPDGYRLARPDDFHFPFPVPLQRSNT